MATDIELALMAGRAYQSTRREVNWFPTPQGWTIIGHPNDPSGFEAVSFQRGTGADAEIVISFAGTYFDLNHPFETSEDGQADIGLGTGVGSEQLIQAVEYYLQIKAANPEAQITLTGHSLGGGLASLVAVFFGEKAVTFDQAPFANSAESGVPDVPANLLAELLIRGHSELELIKLYEYIAERNENGGIPNSQLVTNIRVDGEFLSGWPGVQNLDIIGSTPAANNLTHGPGPTGLLAGLDLHSMSLLTAFLQNPDFREVTNQLTDLLEMIFDENLYAVTTDPSNTTKTNFLEHLVRHEFGNAPGVTTADHMLDRFTTDLQNIAQDGGLSMSDANMTKALTAFAMQAYYTNLLAAEETLFEKISGGLHFDRSKVADTLDNAKGYAMYFTNYLATIPASDRTFIEASLPSLLDWFIQAGAGGMTATATDQRAFMLGGSGSDTLTGGSQADILVGNDGPDDSCWRLAA